MDAFNAQAAEQLLRFRLIAKWGRGYFSLQLMSRHISEKFGRMRQTI